MTWPVVTAWPGSTERPETRPGRCACTSFSIFIASTMQIDGAGLDLVAVRDAHGEHGALHRGDDRVLARSAGAVSVDALAAALGERAPLRLGLRQPHLEPPSVDLDRPGTFGRSPRPGRRAAACLRLGDREAAVELDRPRGELIRLHDPETRRPRR